MNVTRMHTRRLKQLAAGKVKRVGLLETAGLRLAGLLDGRRSLPRKTDSGWTSSFVDREINGYEEFCSQMWSLLQFENESAFARITELTGTIPVTRMYIRQAARAVAEAETEPFLMTRRRGEEAMTEEQVRSRRMREREKSIAPLREELRILETKLAEDLQEFTQTCSRLTEDSNTIRMAIHRVQEHTRQRLDVYWNAAVRHHPEGDAIPTIPGAELTSRSEQAFEQLHRELMEKAENIAETEAA